MTTNLDGMDGVIVDAHVHIFPDPIVQDRAGHLERDGWFGELYANPRAGLATAELLIASMDAAGIDYSMLCGFPWVDPTLCGYHNDYLADAAARFPDRLGWLGIVVPGAPGAELEARRCFERGAAGLGELNADAQGFSWDDRMRLAPVVEVCRQFEAPVLLHTSEPVGHRYPGKGTATPDRLMPFLEAFPDQRVIAAHWGGGLPFYELMPEIALAARNVVYDCAASTYLYRPAVFRAVIDLVGPERVLFGSDYPLLRQDRFLRRVAALDWRSADEAKAVLGGNAMRLFGLRQREQTGA